jgi:hypothetical protein
MNTWIRGAIVPQLEIDAALALTQANYIGLAAKLAADVKP